jgi:hypothetical protein
MPEDPKNSGNRCGQVFVLTIQIAICWFMLCFQSPAQENPKKYNWLFDKKNPTETKSEQPNYSFFFISFDKQIKLARKTYLAGEQENALKQYGAAIIQYEQMVDDIPPGHEIISELEDRFGVYDEFCAKVFGPAHMDPPDKRTAEFFQLMERRRICRRNLLMKKLGEVKFFDVSATLVKDESTLLTKLLEMRSELLPQTREAEASVRASISDIRKSLFKDSKYFTALRRNQPVELDRFRKVLKNDELTLDLNLLADRVIVGVITSENAVYYQSETPRADVDKIVLQIREKLKEFSSGGDSTFMGHAWKEPCRRIYRALLGSLPPLPKEKTKILVIPDRSLWYLPISVMLDGEDRPFGRDRLISYVNSADLLAWTRSEAARNFAAASDLLIFESLPWVTADQLQDSGEAVKKKAKKIKSDDKIEALILNNPSYPKPSEMVAAMTGVVKKSDAWIGPACTRERFAEYGTKRCKILIQAVPLKTADNLSKSNQTQFYFSGKNAVSRQAPLSGLFASPVQANLWILPVAWSDFGEKDGPLGEGPLLLNLVMFYSGVSAAAINYSDPNWGAEDPYVLNIVKQTGSGVPVGKVLAEFPRELSSGFDQSFEGKPPSWAGWILLGDPN